MALHIFHLLDLWGCRGEFEYINTKLNPADLPSRVVTERGLRLSPAAFAEVDLAYGPFSVDGMSTLACQQYHRGGRPLPYVSRGPDPESIGQDFLSFNLSGFQVIYLYPPHAMVRVVLAHCREQRARGVVVLRDEREPWPAWRRLSGLGWARATALSDGSCQIRTPVGGWEQFHAAPPLVAVPFDYS